MTTLSERVALALKHSGIDQAELAAAVSASPAAISQWLSGRTKTINSARLHAAADALKVNPAWLASGEGSMTVAESSYSPTTDTHVMLDMVTGASLSAGNGEVLWDVEVVEKSHAFQRAWLQKMGVRPERCKLWSARGDSMSPSIEDGATVLIHMADREPKDGKVFALITEDGLKVKRLFKVGGQWVARSDNPLKHLYPDIPLDEHACIIGRAVWSASTL